MIYVVLGGLGAIFGGVYLYGKGGFMIGGLIGLLVAAVIGQRNRLIELEKRLSDLQIRVDRWWDAKTARPSPEAPAEEPVPPPSDVPASEGSQSARSVQAETPPPMVEAAVADEEDDDLLSLDLDLDLADASPEEAAPPKAVPPPAAPATDRPPAPPTANPLDPIRNWLLGGNLMVRVGVVVLLFGFAFLVKYAAARNLVPLELRLAATFAAGIGLLVLGWRLRHDRFGYAITLQGGGIGVMYLTLFAAARLFDVEMVPLPLSFGVMVGLVVFSGILAVLQDAAAMAVLGAAGGFMAPVLLSTGTGSHVALFSYYALLNAGIFGIAWFKAWRWLNLLGFVFTFGIGSAWGLQYYQGRYFATTEPFLILFFAFYLAISVLFALRQPPRLKGYVDGSLVFGMPLISFSLQVGLVRPFPFGLALSAVVLGLVYTGLATALWRYRGKGLAALVEAFLALGVIFGSLAIPLALSGSWTAVVWSLEGAGLLWVGLRQRRWMARSFGLLLQVGSGVAFLMASHPVGSAVAVFNNRFLGGMMVALAGLISAWLLEHFRDRLHALEAPLAGLAFSWGLAWWFGTGLHEIHRCLDKRHELPGAMVFVGLSLFTLGWLHRRVDWKAACWPALGLLPAMILAAMALASLASGFFYTRHPFQGWWLAVWPLMVAIHFILLRTLETTWQRKVSAVWHVAGALLVIQLLAWESGWLMDRLAGGTATWSAMAWGVLLALAAALLLRVRDSMHWPLGPWTNAYRGWLPTLLVIELVVWSLQTLFLDGNPRPLPYLPIINPLDLAQIFVFLVVVHWVRVVRMEALPPAIDFPPTLMWGVPAAGGLLWITVVVARTIHHLAAVPYDRHFMIRSELFQAAVAVLWGLVALGSMITANRLRQRMIWFCGAGLLAVVVVKLFVVDLSGSGTISRIVSFLAVGGLLLVIGFFTPLPPSDTKGTPS